MPSGRTWVLLEVPRFLSRQVRSSEDTDRSWVQGYFRKNMYLLYVSIRSHVQTPVEKDYRVKTISLQVSITTTKELQTGAARKAEPFCRRQTWYMCCRNPVLLSMSSSDDILISMPTALRPSWMFFPKTKRYQKTVLPNIPLTLGKIFFLISGLVDKKHLQKQRRFNVLTYDSNDGLQS